jgi:hypothetical protein
LSYAPRSSAADCIGASDAHPSGGSIARVPLAALFFGITLAFGAIAVWSASAHRWPIAVAAAALAAWMATLAWAVIRKSRL